MKLRDIRNTRVTGKRILLRTDYNIETTPSGKLRQTERITATLPTVRWLIRHRATVIIVSHRGRPTKPDSQLTLKPAARALARITDQPVTFIAGSVWSSSVEKKLNALRPGQIALLENIRFESGETSNDLNLSRRLASFCDLVVNDAFADSHRSHASIVGVSHFRTVYAGLLLQREQLNLQRLLLRPPRPFVAIVGGAKISTKLGLVRRLLKRADFVLLGGALANTVLAAEGLAIGASVIEKSMMKQARGLSVSDRRLKVPCDVIVASARDKFRRRRVRPVGRIMNHERILDIGPDTIDLYNRIIKTAKTVVWNGPMGWYEHKPFDQGTNAIATSLVHRRIFSVVGGGETVDAIQRTGLSKKISWLSTGGGAMLEFIEGKSLPGLKVTSL